MMARLIMAIISTLLEETALVVVVLWGLPQIGVYIPVAVLIALMVAWGAYSVFTYNIGSRALRQKPLVGLPDMVGCRGNVVSLLAPEGMVKIKGELWVAKSAGGEMHPGEQIVVVGQDTLKLVVRTSSPAEDSEGLNSQCSG
ncbi:NfeD family protein [Chloroflexota bacterium]